MMKPCWKILSVITIFTLAAVVSLGLAQETAQEYCDRGKTLLLADDYLDAAVAYMQAIRLQPGQEQAYQGLKEAYSRLGYRGQLREAHRLLEQLAPDDAVGHYALGLLYVQNGDHGYAQDVYRILKNLDADLAEWLLREMNRPNPLSSGKKSGETVSDLILGGSSLLFFILSWAYVWGIGRLE
jgi:tetratricopeptide (TPR) repeat protein